MAELKEGWNGPMKLTVKASYPKGLNQDGSGTQWVGKYAPHKDVLQWDTVFEETGTTKVTVCSAKQPAAGTVYEDAHIEVSPNAKNPQYPFRTMFTKEEKASKGAGGGGGGSKGPQYTPDQFREMMNHEALKSAIAQLTAFAGENAGKVTKEVTMQVAAAFADWARNHGKTATPAA